MNIFKKAIVVGVIGLVIFIPLMITAIDNGSRAFWVCMPLSYLSLAIATAGVICEWIDFIADKSMDDLLFPPGHSRRRE